MHSKAEDEKTALEFSQQFRDFKIPKAAEVEDDPSEDTQWGKITYDLTSINPTKKIKTSEWRPLSTINHTPEFVEWINSITYGYFHQKKYFLPFELYKRQAYDWLKTEADPNKHSDEYNRKKEIFSELDRCSDNTLYFAEKYGFVKEGSDERGLIKYHSKEHNAFLFYLFDCGYCLLVGKPRQIFATTTVGLYALKMLVTRYNYFMKFITANDTKGLEILRDKFKFPFQHLPSWMRADVCSDSESVLHLGHKIKKGEYGYPNSRIEQCAPSPTAINGGSPQMSLIDEVGEVPELINTLTEIRPTLYIDKNQDGNLQLVRSLLVWGTGVSSKQGKMAFELFWTQTMSLWESGNYQSCIFVPIFLDWRCRCSQKMFNAEKKAYEMGTAAGLEGTTNSKDRESLFRMHYPDNYRDMFGNMSNRLVSKEMIDEAHQRIRNISKKAIAGYFDPIYDTNLPTPDDDVPYKIIGATWVPLDDNDDPDKITAWMVARPNNDWRDRYYMGTDPITNETGISFMASTIWDSHIELEGGIVTEAPVCFIYHRKQYDPKATYLQCLLMRLYYDTNHAQGAKKGVPELIENNAGLNYKEYVDKKGFTSTIIYNSEIFDMDMHGGGAVWGINISGRGNRRKMKVVGKLREMVLMYHKNILFQTFWRELETYINVQKADETWQPVDKKIYRDDCLDATIYSYICRLSTRRQAQRKNPDDKTIIKMKYPLVRDAMGNLTRIPVCQKSF